jgi:ParB-like chromosome segregation protein Spo0J
MSQILNFKNIALSHIDFGDFSYSLSPELDIVPDESLTESISRHGILHPPIVRETTPDFYIIVSGRKRLLALQALDTESACGCLVIYRHVPELDVFSLLLEEVQLARKLTTIEKAIFLQKITAITDESQIIRDFLPRLGLAPAPFSINHTIRLFDLEDPIRRSLHHGTLSETVAYDFILLSPQDRKALFEIITSLRLSFSFQKKLLNICRELASRANMSIAALLDNDEVQGILHHQDANPPQKTKNLMLWLSRKHMPRFSQAAEEFRHFIAAMQLPKNISVAHTPFFEDDSMILSITFSNRKSLQDAWEKIRHAAYGNDN